MRRDPAEVGADDDPTAEEQALETDGTKTDQLGDTYRARIAAASEPQDGEQAALPYARYPNTAAEALALEEQWRDAGDDLDEALTQFTLAAAAVMGRIKAGEHLPKAELDAEWHARLHLREARRVFERLDRLRSAARRYTAQAGQ